MVDYYLEEYKRKLESPNTFVFDLITIAVFITAIFIF